MLKCPFCMALVHQFHPNSHIIPEWMYKGIYDEKGRTLEYLPPTGKVGLKQKGYRDSFFCNDCETLTSKLDRFAANTFANKSSSQLFKLSILYQKSGKKLFEYSGIETDKIKRFFYSIVCRAHLSKKCEFATTNKHYQDLRAYILSDPDPVRDDLYDILMSFFWG